ncbi:hypothetical protein CHU92_02545 [Flavobacterium cyanobacteriorum]|uniref:DUF4157 domain-containing protein n=1 Tax=Flavobacterium cyanobacteriorum TaxID=2022802 RepID=A0A255ZTX0_9FLAO|nr:hypothetical protein [Flavobacterium cyanobacteriorum]OYQ44355.1 hypothetical protein CHU92_02545 [Flavobacterium cyanobacteriorum]
MKIIATKYLIPKGFTGIALYPFIIVNDSSLRGNTRFINHEKIHLRQQAEMLILPFYLWYGIEFIVKMLYYGNRYKAYRNVCFEKEAYENEDDIAYLERRRPWNFIKYILKE